MKTVNQVLSTLTLTSDIVTEVESKTVNHYNKNVRYEIVRNGKKYFLSIKEIDVIGEKIKSHIRLDVETDLPRIQNIKIFDIERIEKINKKIEKFKKIKQQIEALDPIKFKNFTEWVTANREIENGTKLVEKLKALN